MASTAAPDRSNLRTEEEENDFCDSTIAPYIADWCCWIRGQSCMGTTGHWLHADDHGVQLWPCFRGALESSGLSMYGFVNDDAVNTVNADWRTLHIAFCE
eukprot:4508684-Amphidinium_carterae.1